MIRPFVSGIPSTCLRTELHKVPGVRRLPHQSAAGAGLADVRTGVRVRSAGPGPVGQRVDHDPGAVHRAREQGIGAVTR